MAPGLSGALSLEISHASTCTCRLAVIYIRLTKPPLPHTSPRIFRDGNGRIAKVMGQHFRTCGVAFPVKHSQARRAEGWPCCVPSKHFSPFVLLSSIKLMGWPEGHGVTAAPAPGQRCMIDKNFMKRTWQSWVGAKRDTI